MRHDFLDVIGPAAQSILGLFGQQAAQQTACLKREIAREFHFFDENERKQNVVVAVVEGQAAAHHFIHDDTGAPPVDGQAVVVVLQHFGREIFCKTEQIK